MDIVLFSPIPFDDLHQRPQKLAELLCDRGARVLYLEPGGVRDALARGFLAFALAVLSALWMHAAVLPGMLGGRRGSARRRADARGSAAPAPALEVVRCPLAVPVHRTGSRFLTAWTVAVHRRFLLRSVLPRFAPEDAVVALVEYPFWGAVLEPGDFRSVFYDCLDDFLSFAGRNSAERFTAWERRLLEIGDGAFASAGALEERLRSLRPGTAVGRVPNGVDVEWFREQAVREPFREGPGAGRPVAGYVGVLGRWLDYDAVDAAVAACPGVDFVFVGPAADPATVARLQRRANFRWLPRRPYADVPGIVGSFDVCLIPFAAGPVARSTNPVKVFEYFALGKPVVTTPLVELECWRAEGLVYWADGAREFGERVRDALAESGQARRDRRVEVARANTWSARAAEVWSVLAASLERKAAARVAL